VWDMCRTLKMKVTAVVEDVQYSSLTKDTWTMSMCLESLMSLTGQ